MIALVCCRIIFWKKPVSFPVKEIKQTTCWLNKSNLKSKFIWGMNNFMIG